MSRIVAVVTTDRDKVAGGGAPIFIASSEEEKKKVAFLLEKIMDAAVHDLHNGQYILVDRSD